MWSPRSVPRVQWDDNNSWKTPQLHFNGLSQLNGRALNRDKPLNRQDVQLSDQPIMWQEHDTENHGQELQFRFTSNIGLLVRED